MLLRRDRRWMAMADPIAAFIECADAADPRAGRVRWAPAKSLWLTGMTAVAIIGGALTFSWGALALFLLTCAITLCGGHSLGMHRRLIHNSYGCPRWATGRPHRSSGKT